MENKSQPHSKSDKNNVLPSENRPIPNSEDSKKYKLQPSLKKKCPEVKHTKTSLRRLQQANPHLQYEMEGSGDGKKVSTQNSIKLDNKNEPLQKQEAKTTNLKKTISLKNPAPHQFPYYLSKSKPGVSTTLASNAPIENSTHSSKNARLHMGFSSSIPRILTSTGLGASQTKSDPFKVPAQINPSGSKPIMKQASEEATETTTRGRSLNQHKPIRRSLSAQYYEGKKGKSNKIAVGTISEDIKKTQYFENVSIPVPGFSGHAISKSKPGVSTTLASNAPIENSTHSSKNARLHMGFSSSTPRILTSTGLGASQTKSDPFEVPAQINGPGSKQALEEATETTTRGRSLNQHKPIKRSLSAEQYDGKKGKSNKSGVGTVSEDIKKTQYFENVSIPVPGISGHDISPITKVSNENIMVFKTPSAHERRSNCQFTPRSTNVGRRSNHPSTPLPTLDEHQKRLNDWLIDRSNSISLFRYLEKFHPQELVEDENKENIEVDQDLAIPKIKINDEFYENEADLAKAALVDLNNLIEEGYPVWQCEGWLELIKSKYSKLQEEPEYWECRGAIEQSRGNIVNAVECYKTAIIQGAEVQVVDNSLDVLLQKFSLLNISIDNVDKKSDKERARIIKDARDIFKSSII